MSSRSHGDQGSSTCSLSLSGDIAISIEEPSSAGSKKEPLLPEKFLGGTSGATAGGLSLKGLPSLPIKSSVSGLNVNDPARAKAVVISGLAMKFIVDG